MCDIADEAQQRQQQLIELALANRQVPVMSQTGHCHNCHEQLSRACSVTETAGMITSCACERCGSG